jgi:hypothetical protein
MPSSSPITVICQQVDLALSRHGVKQPGGDRRDPRPEPLDVAGGEGLVHQLAQPFMIGRVPVEHVPVERGVYRVRVRLPVRRALPQPRIGQRRARLGVPGDEPGGMATRHDHGGDRPLGPQPRVHGVGIPEILRAEVFDRSPLHARFGHLDPS